MTDWSPPRPVPSRPVRKGRVLALVAAFLSVGVLALGAVLILLPDADEAGAPCLHADGRSRELRQCLAPSLVFVETPIAAGSGVLLEDGYVVTNAHVIDPYARADVTLDGETTLEGVEVIGVDAFADIAVLGPVETEREGLRLDPLPDFAEEDEEPDVFLVGFPGGIEGDTPSITLSGGLLSRLREDSTFGHTYVQTDAAIAGGQSGGALVDGSGRLLGISSAGFAEQFALALSADDVAASVERIVAGDGDERRVMPTLEDAGTEPVSFQLTADDGSRTLLIPASPDRRDVRLVVDSSTEVAVDVWTFWGEPIGANETSAQLSDELMADAPAMDPGMGMADVPTLEEPSPGTYAFDVPADEDVIVNVTWAFTDTDVTVELDAPFTVEDDTVDLGGLTLDGPKRGVLDGFTWDAMHTLELKQGDEIEVVLRAGTSDPYFWLLAPGQDFPEFDAQPDGDDGGGGLYDLDATERFTIDESGTWRLVFGTYDGVVTGYELTVERAG